MSLCKFLAVRLFHCFVLILLLDEGSYPLLVRFPFLDVDILEPVAIVMSFLVELQSLGWVASQLYVLLEVLCAKLLDGGVASVHGWVSIRIPLHSGSEAKELDVVEGLL